VKRKFHWKIIVLSLVVLTGAFILVDQVLVNRWEARLARQPHWQEREELQAEVNYLRRILFEALLGTLVLAAGGSYLLAVRFTRPVQELAEGATALSRGDFNYRLPVRGDDELAYLAVAFNRMSERLQQQIELAEWEKQRLKTILASMAEGLIAVDRLGRILLINRAACKMFGVDAREVSGRTVLSLVRHPEVEELIRRTSRLKEVQKSEIRLAGEKEIFLRLTAAPLGQDARYQGAVVLMQDVTELRKLEQLRTEFVANVSHELRTPLTSIRGFVETLLDGAMEDRAVTERFLTIIQSEAERLQRLIDDLLSLSRIEGPRTEVVRQPVDVEEKVRKVLEVLKPLAENKGLQLIQEIQQGLPPAAMSGDLLEQVLLNLIDNAIKYTPAGSVTVRAWAEGEQIRVEVADTGIGIPPESLPRLFERFYRVDKARSRDLGGTGLGLSIVKHILERYQQTIEVRSELGKGSVFSFTLPVYSRS